MSRIAYQMSGKKYGMLTILPEKCTINNRIHWKCECDCGNQKFILGVDIRSGHTKSCGCYRPLRKTNEEVCINIILKQYKKCAQNRNLQWSISNKKFLNLIQSNCYYCGDIGGNLLNVRNKYKMYYNGIDRVNNDIGYHENNVVSCCRICNRAKDIMSQEEFFIWINRVYRTRYYRRTES